MTAKSNTGKSEQVSQSRSNAAKKAAKTRKEHNPNAFSEMGQKGGSASQGGSSFQGSKSGSKSEK